MTAAPLAALGTTQERIRTRLVGALGPVMCEALRDPAVVEIMLNADGRIWIETHDGMQRIEHFVSRNDRRQIIALVADANGASAEQGELAADFPNIDGQEHKAADRFQAIMPPLTEAEVICIRRHASRIIPLAEYVFPSIATKARTKPLQPEVRKREPIEDCTNTGNAGSAGRGIISPRQAGILRAAVAERRNIVIAGSTGSGKTTLANALLNEPGFADCRLITIEDRRELQCAAENRVQMMATRGHTLRELVQKTLRMRPDRIVVGEVRDGAALNVLKAWNTGHPGGLLTIHADGAMEALERLEELIMEVSADPQKRMIGRAIDYVVFITGRGAQRRVQEIVRVIKHDGKEYVTEEVL